MIPLDDAGLVHGRGPGGWTTATATAETGRAFLHRWPSAAGDGGVVSLEYWKNRGRLRVRPRRLRISISNSILKQPSLPSSQRPVYGVLFTERDDRCDERRESSWDNGGRDSVRSENGRDMVARRDEMDAQSRPLTKVVP